MGSLLRRYLVFVKRIHNFDLFSVAMRTNWSTKSRLWSLAYALVSIDKFFDLSDWKASNFLPIFPTNFIPRPDNKHLLLWSSKERLEKFVSFPLKTEIPKPSFLLVTTDVETGDAVTFDSYEKNTKYYSHGDGRGSKHTIFYERGIEVQHVPASGAFPNLFDYPKFNVKDSKNSNKRHDF